MKLKLAVIIPAFALTACTTINPYTGDTQTAKVTSGALIGAGVGILAGIISGDDSRERRKRALIGAGVGAIAGGGVGYYMDVQEAELRKELADTGIVFQRQGNNIVMAIPGNVTFDVNKAEINPQFYPVLDRMINVLKKRNKTLIEIAGHTDNTGSNSINLPLSKERARSVANYMINGSVLGSRIAEFGLGSEHPIAENTTAEGRQMNRRVEITLVPIT